MFLPSGSVSLQRGWAQFAGLPVGVVVVPTPLAVAKFQLLVKNRLKAFLGWEVFQCLSARCPLLFFSRPVVGHSGPRIDILNS